MSLAGHRNWLVTGVGGYVGAEVATQLGLDGFGVLGFDNFLTGRRRHVEKLGLLGFHDIDLRDPRHIPDIVEMIRGFQGIVHCAGLKRPSESILRPLDYYQANLISTRNLLESAEKAGVSNFLLSSSCSVYGETKNGATEQTSLKPDSPYARSKAAAETLLSAACISNRQPLTGVALRYFNVVGVGAANVPDLSASNIVPALARASLDGSPITLFGRNHKSQDGFAHRDFVDVTDMARAHVLVARDLSAGRAVPSVINIGSSVPTSVWSVTKQFQVVSGIPLDVRFGPARPGDPSIAFADVTLAENSLDWSPRTPLLVSLENAWRAYKELESVDWNL